MRPYVELPGLSEIVLEESYVLDVRAVPGERILDVDFVVTRDHPAYTPPAPSEVECFRRGSLRLTGLERLVWDDQGRPPAIDASGERDFGHIDFFEWEEGRYLLSGDFGRIEAQAKGMDLVLSAAA